MTAEKPASVTVRQWQRCPVCMGAGCVARPPWVAGDLARWVSGDTGVYTCPTCKGRGVIVAPPSEKPDPGASS